MNASFTILVVEDSTEDWELLREAISRVGLRGPVRLVRDGQEAVDYLEGRDEYEDRELYPFPKVIISDLKMPRVNGLELLQWLRRHPRCAVIPAILLSGSGLTQDIEKAYRLGANTYFRKPSDFGGLVELVNRLREYWSRSELPAVA